MTKTDLDPVHGPGGGRRRCRHRDHQRRGWLADHDVRREHRRHGAPPGSTRRRPTTSPRSTAILLGLVPEVRRDRQRDATGSAGRDHAGALRHDRPARRQDLEGEQRRLRQPGQPGAGLRPASSLAIGDAPWRSPTTSSLTGIALGTILVDRPRLPPGRCPSGRRATGEVTRRSGSTGNATGGRHRTLPASGHVAARGAWQRLPTNRRPSADCAVAGPRGPRLNRQRAHPPARRRRRDAPRP